MTACINERCLRGGKYFVVSDPGLRVGDYHLSPGQVLSVVVEPVDVNVVERANS